jgi:hypothetical protein
METATTVKRRRGRPRIEAPPRPVVHVRIPPALKEQLERDAAEANRSLTKEIEVRLERSYLLDDVYGGSRMASMFREMADVALGVTKQKNGGSFFDDFEVFVFVRDIWQIIVQRHMPRPGDELLDEVRQKWDAFKTGSPQTPARLAAWQWLILQTPLTWTLAQALAGSSPVSDRRADTPEPATADDMAIARKTLGNFGLGLSVGAVPSIGSLGSAIEGVTPSDDEVRTPPPGSAEWPIGSLAKAMEGLIPSQGSVRAAAEEVSRLAQLLADATEKLAGHTVVSPIEPDPRVLAVQK